MTTTHTNISLFEGEIRIYDEKTKGLLASTHDYKSDLVVKLDRKQFVKPKVDVEELAKNYTNGT